MTARRHAVHAPAVRAGLATAGGPAAALPFAVSVIREADAAGQPADRLLRARLRSARLDAATAREVVRAVFAWYRWRGFVGAAGHPADGTVVARALALARRFADRPETFADAELIARALSGWLAADLDLTAALVRALQREPVLWLRARRGQAEALAGGLPGARAGLVPGLPEAVRFDGEQDLFHTAQFAQGRFEIQDVASQAVGLVCRPVPGETWWDACAGEGGKTLHLADLMENRGLIWASDRSTARLDALRRRAARARVFNYRAVPWDGGPRPPTRTRFDGVLVDAPCSGVGTWQRNPHARWTTGPDDVREMAAMQARLLDTAAGALKPGGRLVYAVCTLTRAETVDVAADFAARHPEFAPIPFVDPFSSGMPPAAQITWLPQDTGGNGMFVAAWKRRGPRD
jgi:16S rRNA (cytosine967-C5)-methyltransferase